jgi:hypothetical protein
MARTVTTPQGEVWRVRRLWAPRLRGEHLWSRFRRRNRGARRLGRELGDTAGDGCLPDSLDDLALGAALVLAVLFLLFVGFPFLFALIDVVVILVLTGLGLVTRVLFRRPWVVEATGGDQIRRTWRVVGWRASHEAVDDVADALAHGHPPPPGSEASPRRAATPTDR